MNHSHSHHSKGTERRRLWGAVAITASGFVLELIGGVVTGSLGLLSDAGHMLTHLLALGLALSANIFATLPTTRRNTFGFYRLEILAALVNGIFLFLVTFWILYASYQRLLHPAPIAAQPMLVIAIIGLIANLVAAWLLAGAGKRDLNIRSAVFHLVADTLSSVAVIGGGILLVATGWLWIDPALGVLIGLFIMVPAFGLVKESVDILLEAVPKEVDIQKVGEAIVTIPGILHAHDIHIWTLTSGLYAMSAHIGVDNIRISETQPILAAIETLVRDRFSIHHMAIQFECVGCEGPLKGHI